MKQSTKHSSTACALSTACGATRLIIYGDSNLIVQQTMKDCKAVADNVLEYQKLDNILDGDFDICELNHVSRANNTEADGLAIIGSTPGLVPPGVFLESIGRRSIKPAKPLKPPPPITKDEIAALQEKMHLPPPSK